MELQTATLSPNTLIKNAEGRVPGQDPLDSLISQYYESMFTSRSLQNAVAPLSKTRVTFSRMYHAQKVAVDFQVGDKSRHWSPDLKRKWCHEHGITYVPIGLTERMTVEQFKDRLTAEKRAMGTYEHPQAKPANLEPVEVMPEAVDPVDALLARPETVVGLTSAVEARLSKGGSGTGKTAEKRRAHELKQMTEALRGELTLGTLASTPEAVDAWLASRE